MDSGRLTLQEEETYQSVSIALMAFMRSVVLTGVCLCMAGCVGVGYLFHSELDWHVKN